MIFAFWNFYDIIFFAVCGVILWIMLETGQKDRPKKLVNPRAMGLAVAVISGFNVGVYFLVSVAFYFLLVHLFNKLFKIEG